MLALPGSAYIYQGEELGLPEAVDIPDQARQDPTFFSTPEGIYGRDGCRVPLPWDADAPAFGFSPTGKSWLPQPASWAEYAASAQVGADGSTLEMYKAALTIRREQGLGSGQMSWNDSRPQVLDFTVGDVRVIVNMSDDEVDIPDSPVSAGIRAGRHHAATRHDGMVARVSTA